MNEIAKRVKPKDSQRNYPNYDDLNNPHLFSMIDKIRVGVPNMIRMGTN